ncbi:flagellar basal body-associated FliL family protein [Oceanisphaera pacifica]|uniref:Flagellar protein FliL n=1 Tax=Oceanisphaera pacifica TaxID=2818389 RepID=A0ABS3NF40_9GAMM|nr:flagellar basal body-associated FliL family protein [Oceanisphaera pacifica]MBO1519184.1 flagellar basal body-associated FliL family protein [Oceanisphaera pacifica]
MADDLIMPKVAWYKRKIILILIAVLLLGIGGAGVWFLKPSGNTTEEQPVVDNKALYIGLNQPFIFPVVAGRRERLVQVEVQLMVRGDKNQAEARRHLPLLESTLLEVFSRQSADNYITADGKQTVRNEAVNELNAVLTEELGTSLIEKVLFTSIVMQ